MFNSFIRDAVVEECYCETCDTSLIPGERGICAWCENIAGRVEREEDFVDVFTDQDIAILNTEPSVVFTDNLFGRA